MAEAVTVLHVSDMQFGANHLFGGNGLTGADQAYDTLFSGLHDDLARLARSPGLRPDLVVVTGDLAEWARPAEYEQVLQFLTELAGTLGLDRRRVAVVPGNHDISRKACSAYFDNCEADGTQPKPPYWPKWRQFLAMFEEFYRGVPGVTFQVDQEWTLFEMPDVPVVVAGLNSTMAESHREDDHHGWVGEAQCRWFADRLRAAQDEGWLRIGALHHNLVRGAVRDDENLRDVDTLDRVLGARLNLVLHGHTHDARLHYLGSGLPVLSTGSAAVTEQARPTEVPNQYEIVVVRRDGFVRYARQYARAERRWIGDTRVDPEGSRWRQETAWQPVAVGATFPSGSAPRPQRRDRWDGPEPAPRRGEDFVERVAEVCRLRHPDTTVTRVHPPDGPPYLRVTTVEDRFVVQRPVGVAEHRLDAAALDEFVEQVHRGYAAADPQLMSELVYGGPGVGEDLVRDAHRRGVRLLSLVEYQGLLDLGGYVRSQTARLEQDQVYPPALYVPQRYRMLDGTDQSAHDNALAKVIEWLTSDQPRFVLLLGDFGRGKTFLLHELARRLPAELPHVVPMLVELRALEKARTVEELVAQHLAASGMDRIDLPAFRYMLRTGRIALLFDGFDELALRVSYERAADHLRMLLAAIDGQAKMVVTSRTQHFVSEHQVRTALGDRVELVSGRRLAHLEDFTDEQIRTFLVRLFGGDEPRADSRLALIRDIHDLLGLSRNPRMLTFIAELDEDRLRAAQAAGGGIGSAELYRELLGRWLGYEDVRAHPPGAAPALTMNERWNAVTALALRLWETTDRFISLTELSATAAGVLDGLAERQLDTDQATHMVGSGTLLARVDDGLFTFVHQSVMEWLVAAEGARLLRTGERFPEVLATRTMSPLMVDFLCGLAGSEQAIGWAMSVLIAADTAETAKANALLVTGRLGVARPARAALTQQNLHGADLSGQDLRGADLTGADLTDARLVDTRLDRATMRGARLTRAHLDRAVLADADLTDADLTGARLNGVDLRGAITAGSSWRYASLLGGQVDAQTLAGSELHAAAIPGRDPAQPTLAPTIAPSYSVAVSPDGLVLAAGYADGRIILVDVQSAQVRRILTGHTDGVWAVAFSPDGQLLASASDDATVRLWNPSTGSEAATLTGHTNIVRAVAFNPGGHLLASASDDATVRLWNPATRQHITMLTGHTNTVWAVAFSPGGHLLATASDDGVRLWDPTTGHQTTTLTGHTDWVQAVAFSPDGRFLASASDDATVRLWNPTTGHQTTTLTGHTNMVRAVAFSPDGHLLATASYDATVRLWNPTTGHQTTTLTGHTNAVQAVAFSPDGHLLATASADRTLRLWNPITGQHTATLTGHTSTVWAVAFSPDGHLLTSASADATVRLWDPATYNEIATLVATRDGWAALLPDGRYKMEGDLASAFWWTIKLCRFEPGELDPYIPAIRRIPVDAPLT